MADEVKTAISDAEVEGVQGGAGSWEKFAKGTYTKVGDHILYKIAAGDALSGIALRFGVSVQDIQKWNPNEIKNVNVIYAGHQIVTYPKIIR